VAISISNRPDARWKAAITKLAEHGDGFADALKELRRLAAESGDAMRHYDLPLSFMREFLGEEMPWYGEAITFTHQPGQYELARAEWVRRGYLAA
jgi:hypothetical protein